MDKQQEQGAQVAVQMAEAADLTIPAEQATQEDLNTWYKLQEQLAKLKDQELTLRNKIFKSYFAAPKEGTNTMPLSEGWVLKGEYKINRTVDVATLTAKVALLRTAGVPMDDLIRYKPELVTTEYRKLTDERRQLFDEVLIIKVGTPSLDIVLPKRK